VLDLTVEEALSFFTKKEVNAALQGIHDVGLG
jgi:excinuclease UvrABC ATPase subunit